MILEEVDRVKNPLHVDLPLLIEDGCPLSTLVDHLLRLLKAINFRIHAKVEAPVSKHDLKRGEQWMLRGLLGRSRPEDVRQDVRIEHEAFDSLLIEGNAQGFGADGGSGSVLIRVDGTIERF